MSKYDHTPCDHKRHVSDSNCYYAHKRLATESAMIRGLIRGLKKEGWLPTLVNDQGDELIKVKNETEAMDAVFAVDVSALGFSKGEAHHSFMIVLGNGVDCISDWNYSRDDADGFNALAERITDELYERHENDSTE